MERGGDRATGTWLVALIVFVACAASALALVYLQSFLIVISIPLLLLSALIEQQRRTAAELNASRARYISIVEDQTEMICRLRVDGRFTFVNEAFCRFAGFSRSQMADRDAFEVVPRESLEAMTPSNAAVSRERRSEDDEGTSTWQRWTDRGIFQDGRLVEVQSVGRDITSEKLGEERDRELLAQRQVEQALREADRRKDEFIAMLGHELRNPLSPIGAGLELLCRTPDPDPRAARMKEVMARQLRHLTRMVDDLLDVSRFTKGDVRLVLEPIDAVEIARQAVEAVSGLLEQRRHTLTVSLPAGRVSVEGDPVRLTQVLVNLLNNAAKYTDPGGHIRLSMTVQAARIVISVSDDGIGIAPEMLGRVFQLFDRGEVHAGRAQNGLGIGLTLTKHLVGLHGGTITIESEGRGCGTKVVVELPVAENAAAAADGLVSSSQLGESQHLDVLVIDDNVDAADTLAALVSHWGHRVRAVYTGAAAVLAVNERQPDVVISDIGLPDFSGLELAKRLRREVQCPRLLVAITALGQKHDRARSIEAGFDHHLVKPVDARELAALLADVAA